MKAKETGQTLTGAAAMNEDRIHELQELGFVWALRGSEGKKESEEAVGTVSEHISSVVAADDGSTGVAPVGGHGVRASKEQGVLTSISKTQDSVNEAVAGVGGMSY